MRRFLALASALIILVTAPATCGGDAVAGSWIGHWEDHSRGHCGPLRARFEPCGDTRYRAVFTGRFRQIIPFRYAVTLKVVKKEGDKVYLAGESRLPFFGTFTYQALATSSSFVATFDSCRYQGRFVLERCGRTCLEK